MSSPLFMGVDVGSQSVKAALFRLDGTCLAEAAQEIPLHRRSAEEVEQDPEDFYNAAARTMAESLAGSGARPGEVGAIGVAGQMAGVLGVDSYGRSVTPYDSWLDSRCLPELDEIEAALGDRVTELTGCPPMVAHAPKMLWWSRRQPEIFARVNKFVVPSAFVAGRLAGLQADESFIDWTYLHFSGLADVAGGRWSAELADAIGTGTSRLPRIVAPTEKVGTLTITAAKRCGLLAGTPLAAGLGDTAAGALGAGVVQAGQLLDTAGTASVLAISTDRFCPDPSRTLVCMRGALPGQWFSLSYLAGGDLLTWLPRTLGAASLEALMDEAAAAPPGRLIFVPHLGGRILPSAPRARGAWMGLDLAQGRGDLVRSVLESIAFEFAGFLSRALQLFPSLVPAGVRVIGGGSENELWNTIKAAALGLTYAPLPRRNFTCWGAAVVAAAAVGAADDIAALALAASPPSDKVKPGRLLRELYARRRLDYIAAVDLLVPSAEPARL